MKIIANIFTLLIPALLHAQVVQADSIREQNSARNVQFAFDHVAEKIGQGICYEFVCEAVKQSHPKDYKIILDSAIFYNVEKFRIKDSLKVISGDVVLFENIVYNSNAIGTAGHVGIVLDNLIPDGFSYADQNHGEKNGEKIKVIDNEGIVFDVYVNSEVRDQYFSYKSIKSGTIKFYRF